MKARKILTLAMLTIMLIATIGAGTNMLPRLVPANAIACPTGGPTNGCLTVSLDATSRPTTIATAACSVPSGQLGVCDTTVTTSSTNHTTFRVGAILNASAANRATSTTNCGGPLQISCGVFGWQFIINYNASIVTPIGDPSSLCTAYPDCAESTVWFGSQANVGTVNWANFLAANQATSAISITEDPVTHEGTMLVGYSFLFGSSPVVISARTVLANVAFELLGKGVATFRVSDVIFTDQNAVPITGIRAAPTLSNDPLIKFVDTNSNGVWDTGEPVVYDKFTDGKYTTGKYHNDTLIAGVAPANNTLLTIDPKIRYFDTNGLGVWAAGDPVSYDTNGNFLYDSGEPVIAGGAPATPCNPVSCGVVTDTITNDPPHARFTSTQVSGNVWMFDGTGSTDSDGSIPDPLGYIWDFGDGTSATGSIVLAHDYSVACTPICPNGASVPGFFDVTLRVKDDGNATGSARTAAGTVILNTQPSHISHRILANLKPVAVFTHAPSVPLPGDSVNFNATASTDDDPISSFSWSFGDGSPNATGITTSHAYTSTGSYIVTLAVTDSFGATTKITQTIIVDTLPSLTVTVPSKGQTGSVITITLSSSASSVGGAVSIKVDWGDGKTDNLPGTATSATHTYTTAGNYNVTITATDQQGKASAKSQAINVTAAATGLDIPGGVATLVAVPLVAIAAAALILLRRKKKPTPAQ